MSFTGGTNLGTAYGSIKIGSDLKGVDTATKSLQTFEKQAESAAKKISAQFKSIGDAAKKAGAILSASVTAPLVIAGKKAITAASDLNEAMSATDVVFGEAAKGVQAFADTTDDALGISKEAALAAAVQYSVFGKQAGLTGDALASFSEQLVQNSADLASFFNKDPSETLNAIRSGLAGEMEPLRNLGIILSEDSVKQEAYRLGLAKTGEELSQGAKVLARYSLIQQQMGDAQGDFARTADGLANAQRRLLAIGQDLMAMFGQVMLPTVQKLVLQAIEFEKRLKSLSPEMQALVIKVGLVVAAIGPALIAFGALMSLLSKVGAAAALLTGPLGLIVAAVAGLYIAWRNNWFNIQGIVETVVGNIQEIFGKLLQFLQHGSEEGFSPWRTALRALIRLLQEPLGKDSPIVLALQGILRNGEKFGDWLQNDFLPNVRAMKDAFLAGDWSGVGKIFEDIAKDAKGGWDKTIGPWLHDMGELGKDILGGILISIKQTNWDELGDTLGTAIQDGLARLSEFGSWVVNAIKGLGQGAGGSSGGIKAQEIARELTGWLSDRFKEVDWPKLGDDLLSGIQRAVGLFLDFQKWRFEKLLQVGQFIADRIAEVKWDEVGQKILDAWRPAWDTFMEGVRTDGAAIAQQVLDAVKNAPWDKVGQQVNDSLQGVLAFLNQFGTWVKEQIAGVNWDDVGSFIADKMEGAVNAIYAVIYRVLDGLKDFGGWVRDRLVQAQFADVNDVVNRKGEEIAQGLKDGITTGFTKVTDFVKGINAQLQSAMDEKSRALQALLNKGGELMEGLKQGAVDKFEGVRKFFEDFPDAMKEAVGKNLPAKIKELIDQGASLIDGLRHGAVDFFNNNFGPNFIDKLPQMIVDGIGSLLGTLEDAGRDLIEGLWTGISGRFDQLIKDLQSKVDDLKKAITGDTTPSAAPGDPMAGRNAGIGPDWSVVADQSRKGGEIAGEAGGEGYNQAIADSSTDIQKTQEEVIQEQYDAAAAKLEAQSPSKLFARLGGFSAQGYIDGLRSLLGQAEQAGQDLAQAAETGVGGVVDKIKSGLGSLVGGVTDGLGKIATTAKTVADANAKSQETSDNKRVASAEATTDKMTTEELARAAATSGALDTSAADTEAAQEKRLQAEHDYARASIENERTRVKAVKDANADLEKTLHDTTVKRAQNERDLARQLTAIEEQRVEAAKQAEQQLADLASQRADIETQAAQQRADVESNLQDQLNQAQQQFNETEQENLSQQAQIREELANQLKEAAAAWKEADKAALESIRNIKDELKKTLQEGREEFERLIRDSDLDVSRLNEDFQRSVADLDVQRSRIKEDLAAALVDPSLSPEQRANARIDAARQLEDLDRRQADLEIDHARAIQDAETARHDAEVKHAEEEKAARDAAHAERMAQKQAQKQAEKDYHDRRMELENDAAERIGQLQDDLGKAASDLRTTQAGLRDEAVGQIQDIADQEAQSMSDLKDREQEIFDQRAQNFKDLEDQKTATFREAEQNRTLIAREEQKARDLAARTQDQAERNAAKAQRQALRQLNSDEDSTDKGLAQRRGTTLGETQGKGIATGLTNVKNSVQQSGENLGTSASTGFTTAADPKGLGTTWANSLISGMLSRLGGARSAGNQLATAAEDGFRDASEMQSPSKVGFNLGALYGKSISMGMLSTQGVISDSFGALVGAQAISKSGIASQVAGQQQQASTALSGASGPLLATVVIQDGQLRQYTLGVAIAPMVRARDRVTSMGAF